MSIKFIFASLLASSFVVPAFAQQNNNGLPPVRNSAYMGTPGDGIRSDMGNAISGQAAMPARGQVLQRGGLPPVRTSAYMGTPGDGIRSDMGKRIAGGPVPMQTAPAQRVGLPPVRTSACMGQPGDGIRSDMGHRISGQSYYSRSTVPRPVYVPQPAVMGYGDYRKEGSRY